MAEKIRILIVEDELLLAEMLLINLTKHGYLVTGVASNMTEAVALFKQGGADLALLDIGLSGPEDGVKTALEIQRMKWIPIIYITGRPLLESLARVKETAPAAFLQKPIRFEEVLVQIELAIFNFNNGNTPAIYWQDNDYFYVPYQKGFLGIRADEVLFIRSDSNYAEVYLSKKGFERIQPQKNYGAILVYVPMGTLLRELPPFFFKLSRFEVINLRAIERIEKSRLFLENHERAIPEGRRTELFDQLKIILRKKN